jgi:hypothetical protein
MPKNKNVVTKHRFIRETQNMKLSNSRKDLPRTQKLSSDGIEQEWYNEGEK